MDAIIHKSIFILILIVADSFILSVQHTHKIHGAEHTEAYKHNLTHRLLACMLFGWVGLVYFSNTCTHEASQRCVYSMVMRFTTYTQITHTTAAARIHPKMHSIYINTHKWARTATSLSHNINNVMLHMIHSVSSIRYNFVQNWEHTKTMAQTKI